VAVIEHVEIGLDRLLDRIVRVAASPLHVGEGPHNVGEVLDKIGVPLPARVLPSPVSPC
jgi:hypothetical protein